MVSKEYIVETKTDVYRARLSTYKTGGLAGKTIVAYAKLGPLFWVTIEHELLEDPDEASVKFEEYCVKIDDIKNGD